MTTTTNERLEHLFSRVLDDEATPAERALCEALCREHPQVGAAFEDYRRLDEAVGDALRATLRQPQPRTYPLPVRWWTRAGKVTAVAAAACLAAFAWLHPRPPGSGPASTPLRQAAAPISWFAPATPQKDTIEPVPTAYERPTVRVRGVERQWIIVPGDAPGVYRIIQVDRVRTHAIPVQRDF
jgi:hypothetical protein